MGNYCTFGRRKLFIASALEANAFSPQMLKHIFGPITDHSSRSRVYANRVTRIQSAVLRQIGGRGHFRLREKDGSHTIRSAIAENPLIYANITTLSFMEPEVLHCGNREFRVFLQKIVANITFSTPTKSHRKKMMQTMLKYIF